jgi:hypothetical protein
MTISYKFNEKALLEELQAYIDTTYDSHYSTGKIQATEDIIDDGHGIGFCVGNAKKYLKRYGKKGESPVEWRKDLTKVLHYALITLYVHDTLYGEKEDTDTVYFTDNLGYNGYMNSTMDFSASYPYTLTTTVPTFSRDQVNYETK